MLVHNKSIVVKYAAAYSFTKWLLSFKLAILGDYSNSSGATIKKKKNVTSISWELPLKSFPGFYKHE